MTSGCHIQGHLDVTGLNNLSHAHEDHAEPSLQVVYEEPEGKSLNVQLNFIPPEEHNTALPSIVC